MTKTCKECGEDKPFEAFYRNPNVSDGHLNYCRPCFIERHRAGRAERRNKLLAYVQAIKLERGCADCGYREHAAALDFDHLPGHTKVFRVAQLSNGATKAKIHAEIAKCDVVCANCHRVRTANRRVSSDATRQALAPRGADG